MESKRLMLQLRTFERLLTAYEEGRGREPLSRFLTLFFKQNKQMGSNDRRRVTRWIYNYYRLGNALADLLPQDRLVAAEYLCHTESELVLHLAPDLHTSISRPWPDKVGLLEKKYAFKTAAIFPLFNRVSDQLNKAVFLESLFTQPDLFIRVHPKKKEEITAALTRLGIDYAWKDPTGIALANGTKLDQFPELKGNYEVQDLSSQRTAAYYQANTGEYWWDACAASGGKSLLLWQSYPGVNLLVSDIRPSILRNLDERFDQAGLRHYREKIIDLTKDPYPILGNEQFDGILLDVPCSGSGTWGRTPEMMRAFHRQHLDYFVDLQRQIAVNTLGNLKAGCPLIYMTCSVYADENENQVQFLEGQGLRLEKMQLLEGYHEKADTLFVARLIKNV